MALEMLRSHELGLRPLEDWLASERRRKAQEEREIAEIEADALAQVARLRKRWCIGSGESLWSMLYLLMFWFQTGTGLLRCRIRPWCGR